MTNTGSSLPNEKRQKKPCPVVILFADIIGSVDFADTLPSDEYQSLLSQFHEIALSVVGLTGRPIIRGDELCVIVECKTSGSSLPVGSMEIWRAVEIARELKVRWLTCPFNQKRMEDFKRPIDIAVGINFGFVLSVDVNKIEHAESITQEGHPISLAKRIEGTAREYGSYTRIVLSRKAYQIAVESDLKVHWAEVRNVPLRGISREESVHEIRCFYEWVYWNEVEVVRDNLESYSTLFRSDYSNSWLGIMVATSYFYRREFQRAIEVLERILWVTKDIPVAWILLGECYLQEAIASFRDQRLARDDRLKQCQVFFQKAEQMIMKAVDLDKYNEDVFVELGLLYYDWSIISQKWVELYPEMAEKANDLRRKASEAFRQGSIVGISKTRAAYWTWVMRTEDIPAESRIDVVSLGCEIGWLKRGVSRGEAITVILNKAAEHIESARLPNYRATVFQYLAATVADQFGDDLIKDFASGKEITGRECAQRYLKQAIEIAKEIKEKLSEAAIYSTASRLSEILPVDDFMQACEAMLDKLRKGQPLIPRRGPYGEE